MRLHRSVITLTALWILLTALPSDAQDPECEQTIQLSGVLYPETYQATDLVSLQNATVMNGDDIEVSCQHEIAIDAGTSIYGTVELYITDCPNYLKYTDIEYDQINGVESSLLSMDIYTPKNLVGLVPVMVYVHGGGWRAGDKANVALKPTFFTDQGYIFISVNHRLSPDPPDTTLLDAIRYPDQPNDIAKALAWIHENIHTYNGDKHKIGLTGHSAGAHLAAIVATKESFLIDQHLPPKIPCVAMFEAGAFDVKTLIDAQNPFAYCVQNAVGNDRLQWDEASPAKQIKHHSGLGEWILFSQDDVPGFNLYHQSVIMADSLVMNGYVVEHHALTLNHDEIDLYIGLQDSIEFLQLQNDNPELIPTANAYAVGIVYTQTISNFFESCFSNLNSREAINLNLTELNSSKNDKIRVVD